MSLLRCDNCDGLIDTDDDPGAYDEHSNRWLCERCRELPVTDLSKAEAMLADRGWE